MPEEMVLTLQEWRGLKGYNKEELARKSGVSSRSIFNYEKDVKHLRNAEYSNIKSICDVLGIKVNQIFLGDTSEKPKQGVKEDVR